ncbi:hypothetical protein KAI87_01555 [Myxococcota bacterium]|nr:hypothetical protein [Myxococcota bacterium]
MTKDAPPGIYEAIKKGFREYYPGLLHPDYPEDLLDERLEHYLPELPFLYTGNYVWRMILRKGRLTFDDFLNIGKTSHRELIAVSGLNFFAYGTMGIPYAFASYDPDLHEHSSKIETQERIFLLLNEDADDPWDDYSKLHPGTEAQRRLSKIREKLPASAEMGSDPFVAWIYLQDIEEDLLEIVKPLSQHFRALLISTASISRTERLHWQLNELGFQTGRLMTSHIREVPRGNVFKNYVRSKKRQSVQIQILLRGKLYDYSL